MMTKAEKREANADRRMHRRDRKISRTIRQIAADLMSADPSIDLGQAMTRAIRTVAESNI